MADSPFAQPRHRLLCHQGDHLDPVGTKASPFTLLDGTRVRVLTPNAPWSHPQIQPHQAGLRHSAPQGDISLRLVTRRDATWKCVCHTASSQEGRPQRDRGQADALGTQWLCGRGHLPRGRALRGDRGLRGSRRGPEMGERQGRAISTPPCRHGDKPGPAHHPENGLTADATVPFTARNLPQTSSRVDHVTSPRAGGGDAPSRFPAATPPVPHSAPELQAEAGA